jgi:hypothetical protein
MHKRPTEQEIIAKMTTNGGYTKTQLAEWGVAWPPPKGWKQRLIEGTGETRERHLNSHQEHRIHETKDLFEGDCFLCQKVAKVRQSHWESGE